MSADTPPVDSTFEEMRARVMAEFNGSNAVLGPLAPRRFWLAALSLGITEAMVDAKINALPEAEAEAARIDKRYAQAYQRDHPLVLSLPEQFDITAEQLDEAWRNAPE